MINWRKTAIGLVAVLLAGAAFAQSTPGRIARVGILSPSRALAGFGTVVVPEFARLGYTEGRNLEFVRAFANDDLTRLPELARELATRVDVILAVGNSSVLAASAATRTTPIVMRFGSTDPVSLGLAKSLAKPNTNVTGIYVHSLESDTKRLALMQELVGPKKVAFLAAPDTAIRLEALKAEFAEHRFDVSFWSTERSRYQGVFSQIAASGAAGVVVAASPIFYDDAAELTRQATAAGLGTMCEWREMALAGCLASFGGSLDDLSRRSVQLVVSILDGAKPSGLPIERPTQLKLTVNLKTASALGLTIPPAILLRADEVIE